MLKNDSKIERRDAQCCHAWNTDSRVWTTSGWIPRASVIKWDNTNITCSLSCLFPSLHHRRYQPLSVQCWAKAFSIATMSSWNFTRAMFRSCAGEISSHKTWHYAREMHVINSLYIRGSPIRSQWANCLLLQTFQYYCVILIYRSLLSNTSHCYDVPLAQSTSGDHFRGVEP